MNKKVKQKIIRILSVILVFIQISVNSQIVFGENVENTELSSQYDNERLDNNYTKVSSKYSVSSYDGEPIVTSSLQAYKKDSGGSISSETYGYDTDVIRIDRKEEATFVLEVPKDGLYYIKMDYFNASDSILPVEATVKVNGQYPFYEMRNITFESIWQDKSEKNYDRYGNEIVAIPEKKEIWANKYIQDSSYRYNTPFAIELNKGENEISISIIEGTLLVGDITLTKETVVKDYDQSKVAVGDNLITIQGEEPFERNDSSIRANCEYDIDLEPYDSNKKVLNLLDGESFNTSGQTVTYEFEIKEAGIYYIAMNYRQSDKSDFPVFVDIKVDGEIPNSQLMSYPVSYQKSFDTTSFGDSEGKEIGIELSEGRHTLSFTLSNAPIRHVLEGIEEVMNEVNDLALDITKVAGTNKDKYRDLDLISYIPDVKERLVGWAEKLESLYESVRIYNPDVKEIGAFSSINIASSQLYSLAEEPNDLPYRINELCQSTSSVNQFLANLIDTLNTNNLSIDRIYIYQQDAQLPDGVGFFTSIIESASRFVGSFVSQAYSTSNTDPEHLQVWVNRSRQYIEIMQKMIDEDFTKKTGIEVDLSLMPDQNKLVLANASGDSPDIATGINYAIPFELGIRGAIKDLTEFEDFVSVATRFEEGLLVPSMINNGIYSLPETMNFWVLYYRSDVLEKLGLDVPETMDDVREMLPQLQMRGLNFFYPTAGMVSLKTFHGTTPLLFQNGATLYDTYAGETVINSEEAVKGFKELTDLFTIYNLPKDIPSFYQHFRNGDLPIGIADYSVYNLLINAAPEISNSWSIALIPGVENEDGEIVRSSSGGAESTVMFKSNEDREANAWEFMKWWSSAEVQEEFGQTLQITYGEEYIWNTANIEAFSNLPWKTEDKEIILQQSECIVEAPRILGTYMLERELSNAYNAVVVNGANVRQTLDDAIKRINRETLRKLEEFGYNNGKEVIIPYEVPTIEMVRELLGMEVEE